jgi:hypothetical protein
MCEERTEEAAAAAARAARAARAEAWWAAWWAAYAALWAARAAAEKARAALWVARAAALWAARAAAGKAAYWSELAIEHIEAAIKEREPELSDTAPVSNDAGQAQKMDAPEPIIHKHEWICTGAMEYGVCRCIHCGAWNHEVDAQHSVIEQLKAERDALQAEVERLKNVAYDLIGQLTVLNATKQMQASIKALKERNHDHQD